MTKHHFQGASHMQELGLADAQKEFASNCEADVCVYYGLIDIILPGMTKPFCSVGAYAAEKVHGNPAEFKILATVEKAYAEALPQGTKFVANDTPAAVDDPLDIEPDGAMYAINLDSDLDTGVQHYATAADCVLDLVSHCDRHGFLLYDSDQGDDGKPITANQAKVILRNGGEVTLGTENGSEDSWGKASKAA